MRINSATKTVRLYLTGYYMGAQEPLKMSRWFNPGRAKYAPLDPWPTSKPKTTARKCIESNDPVMVYYALLCSHCKRLALKPGYVTTGKVRLEHE